ncbi:MAG: BLUF domain-containing protein [Pseudomonadota bacterium]
MMSNLQSNDEALKAMHGEHILLRLTYISRYNNHNESDELQRILSQAQENNERNGITGVLVFNHNYFLQSIEGRRPVINNLLRKLVRDSRHFALQIIEAREIDQRRWSGWSMNYLTPTKKYQNEALRFSGGATFNPYLMSTKQVMLLIESLTKMQEHRSRAEESIKSSRKLFGLLKAS